MARTEGSPNYPSYLHTYMHPERLAVMAKLRGLEPPPFDRARMLEVGCASAVSLVSFAKDLPGSQFVGFDIDANEIALGRDFATAASIPNLRLDPLDIAQFDESYGQFDYIAAHGVLSWIPPGLRRTFFEICARQLSPNGVIYVSFNAYPGCHLRDLMRYMLRFHTRDVPDPADKVRQVQAVLKFTQKIESPDAYLTLLKNEAQTVLERHPEQVLFDEVAPFADPFYLHEVLELAAEHGFQYLAEADYGDMATFRLPPAVREVLASIPEWPTRMQYRDFFTGCRFHKLLLCRKDIDLKPDVSSGVLENCFLSASITCAAEQVDLNRDDEVEFRGEKDAVIRTRDPVAKAALVMLEDWHPRRVAFSNLCDEVVHAIGKNANKSEVRTHLARLVMQLWGMSTATVTLHAPTMAWEMPDRPRVSSIARWQAERGTDVASLLCAMIKLEDESDVKLVRLLDGTRTLSDARREVTLSDRDFNQRIGRFLRFGLIEADEEGGRP